MACAARTRRAGRLHSNAACSPDLRTGRWHRGDERACGTRSAAPYWPVHQSVLLWALGYGFCLTGGPPPGASGGLHTGRRRPDHRPDGALRVGADPRPRHPRGHRGDPDSTAAGSSQKSPSSSRCRRPSRSDPAAPSARRVRSS